MTKFIGLTMAFCVCAVLLVGCDGDSSKSDPTGTAVLYGTVESFENDELLVSRLVAAVSGVVVRIEGPVLRESITGPEGAFLFTELPPGAYDVSFEHNGEKVQYQGSTGPDPVITLENGKWYEFANVSISGGSVEVDSINVSELNPDSALTEDDVAATLALSTVGGTWQGTSGSGQVETTLELIESGTSGDGLLVIYGRLLWQGDGRYVYGTATEDMTAIELNIEGGDTWSVSVSNTVMTGTGETSAGKTFDVSLVAVSEEVSENAKTTVDNHKLLPAPRNMTIDYSNFLNPSDVAYKVSWDAVDGAGSYIIQSRTYILGSNNRYFEEVSERETKEVPSPPAIMSGRAITYFRVWAIDQYGRAGDKSAWDARNKI